MDKETCAHNWRDFDKLDGRNVVWCVKCNALAFAGKGRATPAHSKSEYKRRVAQGDPNVLPPAGGVEPSQAPIRVVPLELLQRAQQHVPYLGETWRDLKRIIDGVNPVEGKSNE